MSTWFLSTKAGQEAWVEVVEREGGGEASYTVQLGLPPSDRAKQIKSGTYFINAKGAKQKATFECIFCRVGVANGAYIDERAAAGDLKLIPMAVVAGASGRKYFAEFDEVHLKAVEEAHDSVAKVASDELPNEVCRGTFASNAQGRRYGFFTFSDNTT